MLTKDLDKFDMILQAHEYEVAAEKKAKAFGKKTGNGTAENKKFLQQFFDSTTDVFTTKTVKAWDKKLREIRDGT